MTTQPEALRLAAACDQAADIADMGRPAISNDWRRRSAAELRRQHSALEAKDARIAELEAALRFYADETRYQGSNQLLRGASDPHTPDGFPYRYDVTRDHGNIARAALKDAP